MAPTFIPITPGHYCFFNNYIIFQTRAEAVQKLQNMVNETKFITGNLGEAPTELAARLMDSNSKIAASTLALCQSLGTAMGPACKQHVRTFFPGFLQGLGDSKVNLSKKLLKSLKRNYCGIF